MFVFVCRESERKKDADVLCFKVSGWSYVRWYWAVFAIIDGRRQWVIKKGFVVFDEILSFLCVFNE